MEYNNDSPTEIHGKDALPSVPPGSPVSDSQPSTLNSQRSAPFSRLPGESPRAFAAFTTWFQLGHSRSHQAIADKLGEGLPTIKNWASKFDWTDRLLAFNSGLLQQQVADTVERHRKQAADWANRLNHFREQEWDAAQKLLAAAQCFLETFGDAELEKMNLAQVSRALRVSSEIGRAALAGADLPPSSDPVMSPIQQQMLDALARAYSQSRSPSPPQGGEGRLVGPKADEGRGEISPKEPAHGDLELSIRKPSACDSPSPWGEGRGEGEFRRLPVVQTLGEKPGGPLSTAPASSPPSPPHGGEGRREEAGNSLSAASQTSSPSMPI